MINQNIVNAGKALANRREAPRSPEGERRDESLENHF